MVGVGEGTDVGVGSSSRIGMRIVSVKTGVENTGDCPFISSSLAWDGAPANAGSCS